MELEGGIVLAILLGAVLLYDRLGDNDELARRLFQVVLGVSLVFAVVSGTTAFIRPSEDGFEILGGFETSSDVSNNADRIVAATVVHYGFGILFFISGVTALKRMHTVPVSFLLAGVLLVFIGGSLTGLDAYSQLIRLNLDSSAEVDAVAFIAALAGTGALLWHGFRLESEYAMVEVDESTPEDDSTEPPGA